MYRIKYSNGKYVRKTAYREDILLSKNGKVWHSANIVEKNLHWCEEYVHKMNRVDETNRFGYNNLNFVVEEIKK